MTIPNRDLPGFYSYEPSASSGYRHAYRIFGVAFGYKGRRFSKTIGDSRHMSVDDARGIGAQMISAVKNGCQ
jgi:hypothetical protein